MSRNKKARAGANGGGNKAVSTPPEIERPQKAHDAPDSVEEIPQNKIDIKDNRGSGSQPQADVQGPEISTDKEPENVLGKQKKFVPVKHFSKLFTTKKTVDTVNTAVKGKTEKSQDTQKGAVPEDVSGQDEPETDLLSNIKTYILSANPVFVKAVAAVPILGAAISLKSGLMLSGAMFLTIILLNMAMYPLNHFVPRSYRFAAAFIAAGVIITPINMLSVYLAPTVAAMCGIYLPLLAVCAIPMVEKKHYGKKYGFAKTVRDAALEGVGFAFAAIIFSVIREILGKGTLYDRALPYISGMKFPFALLPAGAFLLLGVLTALFRKIYGIKDDSQNGRS